MWGEGLLAGTNWIQLSVFLSVCVLSSAKQDTKSSRLQYFSINYLSNVRTMTMHKSDIPSCLIHFHHNTILAPLNGQLTQFK